MFLGDQKFSIFSFVLGGIRNSEFLPVFLGIRNSEFFPMFLGGSEILNFCLCFWGDQKF